MNHMEVASFPRLPPALPRVAHPLLVSPRVAPVGLHTTPHPSLMAVHAPRPRSPFGEHRKGVVSCVVLPS